MSESSNELNDILVSLKRTSKGRLNYDRNWKEEGRTQEIISDVKQQLSAITIKPNRVYNNNNNTNSKQKRPNISNLLFDSNAINNHSITSKQSPKYKITQSISNDSIANLSLNSILINNNTKSVSSDTDLETSSTKTNNETSKEISAIDLLNYERERQERVRNITEKYETEIKNVDKALKEKIETQMRIIRQKHHLALIKKINDYKKEYKAIKDVIDSGIENNDNSVNSSANHKLKEIESKHRLLVAEQERKQQENRRKQILSLRDDIESIVKSVNDLLNDINVENTQAVEILRQDLHALISILQNVDVVLIRNDTYTDADINCVHDFKNASLAIKNKIISFLNKEKLKDQQKQIGVLNVVNNNVVNVPKAENKILSDNQSPIVSASDPLNSLSDCVEPQALKDYLNLQKFYANFEKSFESFTNDPKCKAHKNDLQLFVKTTINTISCESVDHIRDKLNRLTQLFSGKSVESGGKHITCNKREDALNYCISLSCKMFISVGTKQKDIALTMAPIIVQLWSRFPIFGKVFMAHMQEKCPYAVPYYPKQANNESESSYLIVCGYTINKDGSVESEESFLNRMRAIIKIYAAIIQSNVQHNHPHNINHGWSWIARVLNLEPRPAITAAILESFLSITSHKLYSVYGLQFIKLIRFISTDYINRIEKVSQKETKRQALVKLIMYINSVKPIIERNSPASKLIPEGLIPEYFWHESYAYSRGVSFSGHF